MGVLSLPFRMTSIFSSKGKIWTLFLFSADVVEDNNTNMENDDDEEKQDELFNNESQQDNKNYAISTSQKPIDLGFSKFLYYGDRITKINNKIITNRSNCLQ